VLESVAETPRLKIMMRTKDSTRAAWRALLVALSLAALFSCQKSVPSQTNNSNASALPPVVATVNGRPIQTRLYEMYLRNGQEALGIDPTSEEGRRKLELLKEGIVSELIDRTLIAQEAERRGLSIPPEKLSEAERKAIAQFGGDEKYDKYLNEHNLTRAEYAEVVKTEIYGGLMREELSKGLKVSDEEVKAYYEAHSTDADMQQPERVKASHILIAARPNLIKQEIEREKGLTGEALDRAVREEMERRRGRAEELRRKASSGADFAALAKENSDDPSSREQGGDLGSFTRDSHPRAFDEAAFALRPGTVSSVVQTDFGFHVIKVSAHEPARARTLQEAKEEISQRLKAQREAVELTDFLKQTRRRATVRISEPFRFGKLKDEFPAM
jgi:parvulin-like peptidyl-prolyl isomerase